MPEKTGGPVRSSSRSGVLRLGAVRVHNDHILEGKRSVGRCRLCASGLGGAVATPEAPRPDVVVAEGDGANEGGNPPPPRGDGASRGDTSDPLPW